MARKHFKTMWFIFVAPQQFGGPGNRYIALDGTVTNSAKLAAKFFTARAAHKFALNNRIKLDGATQYIDQTDFDESDVDKANAAELKTNDGRFANIIASAIRLWR